MNHHPVSFIMPAYNCASTIAGSIESIYRGNYEHGDELVVVNDHSTDTTAKVLESLQAAYPQLIVLNHDRNRGGAAARNTAVAAARNATLFCLDADNILAPGSIEKLKQFLIDNHADVTAFGELHYFTKDLANITHKWIFRQGIITFADYLSGHVVPGASGNYMFTRESWLRAGGYPEFAGALDAWGFGLRQVATGSKMMAMSDSYYYHRYGHESYWIRESKVKGKLSLTALQILIPYLDLIKKHDVDYIMSRNGRYRWFDDLDVRPLRPASGGNGRSGMVVNMKGQVISQCTVSSRIFRMIRTLLGRNSLS